MKVFDYIVFGLIMALILAMSAFIINTYICNVPVSVGIAIAVLVFVDFMTRDHAKEKNADNDENSTNVDDESSN